MNRRDVIRTLGLVSAGGTLAAASPPAAAHTLPQQTAEPSPEQRRWMDLKKGLFVHFGINTFYGKEWSDGTLDPARFNPDRLDADQWCRAAAAAGLKYIVLVTKHHDGFCNWPTAFTSYSVRSTPFRGDVVGEVVNAARKNGLAVGFYYSLWDRHEKSHDTDDWAYVAFMKDQLRELLTGYGDVVELWFDGFWKKQRTGWKKKGDITGESVEGAERQRKDDFVQAWRMEGAYRWQMDHLYQYIKSLQPACLVMNNSTTAYPGVPLHPVDVRSGEKATRVMDDQKVWNFRGRDLYIPLQIETTLSVKGDDFFPSGNWFWHEGDNSVATRSQVLAWEDTASRMDANLLINVGPMASGRLRPEDEKLLTTLRSGK